MHQTDHRRRDFRKYDTFQIMNSFWHCNHTCITQGVPHLTHVQMYCTVYMLYIHQNDQWNKIWSVYIHVHALGMSICTYDYITDALQCNKYILVFIYLKEIRVMEGLRKFVTSGWTYTGWIKTTSRIYWSWYIIHQFVLTFWGLINSVTFAWLDWSRIVDVEGLHRCAWAGSYSKYVVITKVNYCM